MSRTSLCFPLLHSLSFLSFHLLSITFYLSSSLSFSLLFIFLFFFSLRGFFLVWGNLLTHNSFNFPLHLFSSPISIPSSPGIVFYLSFFSQPFFFSFTTAGEKGWVRWRLLPRSFLPFHHHRLFVTGKKDCLRLRLLQPRLSPLILSLSSPPSNPSLPLLFLSQLPLCHRVSICLPVVQCPPARRPAPFDPLDGDYRDESEAVQGRVKEAIEAASVGAQARSAPVFTGNVGIRGFTEDSDVFLLPIFLRLFNKIFFYSFVDAK